VVVALVAAGEDACPACDCTDSRVAKLQHERSFIYNDCSEGGQSGCLSREHRSLAIGQKGVTLWMTGLSGSGKSTVGKALENYLVKRLKKHTYRLDGDNVRGGLCRDLGFSPKDRAENVRRVGETAALMADSGTITIASLISPYRADRDIVRKQHAQWKVPFYEVFIDAPLETVEKRDPKGLYKKVRAGIIKSFTGVSNDAPYEAPAAPELHLKTDKLTLDEEVQKIVHFLELHGVLDGAPKHELSGSLLPPDGAKDVENAMAFKPENVEAAQGLPEVPLRVLDYQWLQTVAEGWAAPLTGFMREGTLLQTLHFNSVLVDMHNVSGSFVPKDTTEKTDFDVYDGEAQHSHRISSSVPIILPVSDAIKAQLAQGGNCVLLSPTGERVAMIENLEIYPFRKEEIVARMFGHHDLDHPYIAEHITHPSLDDHNFLLGGEIRLLVPRVLYNDGFDQYRLTPADLRKEFKRRNADGVVAFQTRNPTHAAHLHLMNDALDQMRGKGYEKPLLLLTPLGGWTKADDVPLDVRIKQHLKVISAGKKNGGLDSSTTVMAIWPSPMVYAGPTEVQWHAKSRRNAGAKFFVTGRDPAGLKGSAAWQESTGMEDQYDGNHGRYVMQNSPGLSGLEVMSFGKVSYDVTSDTMQPADPARKSDFLSISGSKMRKMAAEGRPVCEGKVDSSWSGECVPRGFMPAAAWDIVTDYYSTKDASPDKWVQYSTPRKPSAIAE